MNLWSLPGLHAVFHFCGVSHIRYNWTVGRYDFPRVAETTCRPDFRSMCDNLLWDEIR